MTMHSDYSPPLALTILSGCFLASGAVCALVILVDIIMRKGWRSMMAIMIPVYIVNATYLGPLALFIYFKYGRPSKPQHNSQEPSASAHACHHKAVNKIPPPDSLSGTTDDRSTHAGSDQSHCHSPTSSPASADVDEKQNPHPQDHASSQVSRGCHGHKQEAHQDIERAAGADHHSHHHMSSSRPMWATVFVGICHCGAGCVLGDVVGEWIVYGSGWTISGTDLWPMLILDYIFALAFGILFQYFSIAPMSNEYGPKTIWRAVKADVLSLTSFEIGLFGWMIAFHIGIFGYQLDTATWTYWWMMQIGMVIGSLSAYPMNWFLLKWGIKEPCC